MAAAVACGTADSEVPPASEIQEILIGALPADWRLVESREGQGPQGHGPVEPNGQLHVLVGPGPVSFRWQDAAGEWHDEELAREAIEVWVMPGSYRPSLRRFWEHHRQVPPQGVHASRRVRVYAQVSHRLVDEERFNALLSVARSTSWSDIVDKSCTWEDWAEQISSRFRAAYG